MIEFLDFSTKVAYQLLYRETFFVASQWKVRHANDMNSTQDYPFKTTNFELYSNVYILIPAYTPPFIRNLVQGIVLKFLNLWPQFSSKNFLKFF